jgi:hypothetical protein
VQQQGPPPTTRDLPGDSCTQRGFVRYDFFPKTWLMPHDRGLLLQHQREAARVSKHPPVFIFKPSNSCQGKGIALLRSDKKLAQLQNGVVQQYIANPLLIDGHKADIRLYALVTAAVPEFRVFLFEDGLVRLASAKYTAPTAANLGDTYCHLTNYSLNKNSANFDGADGEGEGHKRKYSWLLRWMAEQGMPVAEVERRIHDVVVKTVLSVQSTVAHSYNSMYPGREDQSACCEILGFDIMLDDKLKPWLIEVNQSPSFSCDAELDRGIKSRLVRNTLEMVNLKPYNAYRERAAKTQRLRKMAYRTSRGKGSAEGVSDPSLNERLEAEIQAAVAKEARLSSRAEELRAHEDAQCASGGFTRLFPTCVVTCTHFFQCRPCLNVLIMFLCHLLCPITPLQLVNTVSGTHPHATHCCTTKSHRYVAAKDEVYRAFTTTVPSLTSLTVACSARAKENMETRARVLKVEHDRRARAVDDDERLRAFKNHIKTRSAGAWRKGNPCCSTVSEDGEEASLPPAVRVRRRSPRVRTDLTPLRTRRVSLNIYSEVAAYPISFNVKPPTESETPPAAAGPDIPETPSHTSSVRDVRLGTWDASKCFHKNKPPPKLPNPKLPLSGFALWAASQISGRPLDPERGSTDLTDTCTDLKLPPCEWHKTMRYGPVLFPLSRFCTGPHRRILPVV